MVTIPCMEKCCQGVDAPNVLQKQKSSAYKIVFWLLYKLSNRRGMIELSAVELAKTSGLSRKTIYRAIAFLKRVNLLKLNTYRTGRGKHSTYFLNWRKNPEIQPEIMLPTKSVSPLSINNINIHSYRNEYSRIMKAFRELLESSPWLMTSEARMCARVLGARLKGRSLEFCRNAYLNLQSTLMRFEPSSWVMEWPDLCKSFNAWINPIFAFSKIAGKSD